MGFGRQGPIQDRQRDASDSGAPMYGADPVPDYGSNAEACTGADVGSLTPLLDAAGLASTCTDDTAVTAGPDLDPKISQFVEQVFSRKRFQPSTGLGRFDVRYTPSNGAIVATINLEVFFDMPRDTPYLERPWPWQGDGWTDAEKVDYVAKLQETIEQGWNATPAPIHCVKPGWERFVAIPRIEVDAFVAGEGSASPHYQVTVCRDPARGPNHRRPPVHDPKPWRHGQVSIDEGQVDDTVLGAGADQTELDRILAALPTIRLQDEDGWKIPPAAATALDGFANVLNAALPSMYQPKIHTVGWDGSTPEQVEDNHAAGNLARAHLVGRGVTHPLHVSRGGDNDRGVLGFDISEWERDVQRWPHPEFNMAMHEFGHMLGLNDEYALADDEGHGMTQEQQKLTVASGAEQHSVDADTTSVMSAGTDVLPAHYVTIWDALGQLTRAFLRPTDWQL